MDWKQLLASIIGSVDEELRLRNAYLMVENRVLRTQIKARRVLLSDAERQTLAEIGHKLGRQALEEIATITKPDTILAWHRTLVAQQCDHPTQREALGRPRIEKELVDRVVRLARENRSWGYDRIVGALANLGYTISDQTVGNILKRHGIPPAPERTKTTTWQEFIRIHMTVLGATDFFTSAVWSWYRLVISAVCFFVHCGLHPRPVVGMKVWLHEWWMLPIPWQTFAARWVCSVMGQGRARLLQCGSQVQRRPLSTFVPDDPPDHLPQGRGNVVCLLVVDHPRIRDRPIRSGPQLGGLRPSYDREAA